MKIGLLTDIHANASALRAALRRLEKNGARLVLNAGDTVGIGPDPNECCRLAAERMVSVAGNHDRDALAAAPAVSANPAAESASDIGSLALQWTRAALTPASRSFLQKLPATARLEIAGHRILVFHGSPRNDLEWIATDNRERLARLAAEYDADIYVMGHTHAAFVHDVGGRLFVNPGSLGRPFDGDYRLSMALLDLVPGRPPLVNFARLRYSRTDLVRSFERTRLPRPVLAALLAGRQEFDLP